MKVALLVIAAMMALNGIMVPFRVGKPMKPLSPGVGAYIVLYSAVATTILVLVALKL